MVCCRLLMGPLKPYGPWLAWLSHRISLEAVWSRGVPNAAAAPLLSCPLLSSPSPYLPSLPAHQNSLPPKIATSAWRECRSYQGKPFACDAAAYLPQPKALGVFLPHPPFFFSCFLFDVCQCQCQCQCSVPAATDWVERVSLPLSPTSP